MKSHTWMSLTLAAGAAILLSAAPLSAQEITLDRQLVGENFRVVTGAGTSTGYTEISAGLNYIDRAGGGVLRPSQDLIELDPKGGAVATHGPIQARFAANAETAGGIDFTTASGNRFRSHPVGLFLYSPKSGQLVDVARVKSSIAELLPPNQLIYRSCFDGVLADLRITYTKGAIESDVILQEDVSKLTQGDQAFFGDPSVRLEVWTEFLEFVKPRVVTHLLQEELDPALRKQMVEPDLFDDVLDFGDLLFGEGKAFARVAEAVRDEKTPASIDLSPRGDRMVVAKRWYEATDGRTFLI